MRLRECESPRLSPSIRGQFKSALASVLLLCFPALLPAAVTAVHVVDRFDVLSGKSFGTAGPYEAIRARVEFAVDPKLPANRIITDLDLAPKNAEGLVEFCADLFVLKPRDPKTGNGTALVEISNRGGKALLGTFDFAHVPLKVDSPEAFGDRFLLEQGYTLVWIGWEFDVPPGEDLAALYHAPALATEHRWLSHSPARRDRNGRAMRARTLFRWVTVRKSDTRWPTLPRPTTNFTSATRWLLSER